MKDEVISFESGVEKAADPILRKKQVEYFLGKTVDVIIDRPIGASHPKHPEIVYPINYGGIEGVYSPDGELLDVYILGEDKPLSRWRGRVIAIIFRSDDIEDKLVAANSDYTAEEIERAIFFQERFHKHTLRTL